MLVCGNIFDTDCILLEMAARDRERRKRKKKGSEAAWMQTWGWQTAQGLGNYPLKLG